MTQRARQLLAPGRAPFWVILVLLVYTLAGFFLVPVVIRQQLVSIVGRTTTGQASLQRAEFNPFVLSARLRGLEIRDADGEPALALEDGFVNLQLRSLFRLALVFREITLTGLAVNARRYPDGTTNFEKLLDVPAPSAEPAEDAGGLPRLVVDELALVGGSVDVRDEAVPTPFETQLSPIDVTVTNLSTLPERTGQQQVRVTTTSGVSLGWRGTLSLVPVSSAGTLTIEGPLLPLAASYLQDQLAFSVPSGDVQSQLDYTLRIAGDGTPAVTIANADWVLTGLRAETAAEAGPFFQLAELRASGGEFRWPENAAALARLSVRGAELRVARDADGSLSLAKLSVGGAGEAASGEDTGASEPPVGAPATGGDAGDDPPGPALRLSELLIEDFKAVFEDRLPRDGARLEVADLDLSLRDISNTEGARFPVRLDLVLGGGGQLSASGELGVLPAATAEAEVTMADVPLALAQPYVADVLKLAIDSGRLGLAGTVAIREDEPLAFAGRLDLPEFSLRDTGQDERLVGWTLAAVPALSVSLGKNAIEMRELVLTEPYARIRIAADGSTNFESLVNEPSPADSRDAPVPETDAGEQAEASPPPAIRLGRIRLVNGSTDFADLSLPLPFATRITGLGGEIAPIATDSREPAQIGLEGKVDQYGLARVNGRVNFLAPEQLTQLDVLFRNVDMPTLSGYSAQFAGRRIETGKLELDLRYRIEDRKLAAENRVVMSDFALGERVESPGALELPLDLAVGLLKGPDGNIDIDLPIRGDLDDPDFGYGRVIAKALANLIIRAAAAPFKLLGRLVGIESEDFGEIDFLPGRADLLPPELEKLEKLAEALAQRPGLGLAVPAVADPAVDEPALREAAFRVAVTERLAELGPDAADALLTERGRKALEAWFREVFPDEPLDGVRALHEAPPPDDPQGKPVLDLLAYLSALRSRLVAVQPLPGGALDALADARARNVRETLTGSGKLRPDRVAPGERANVEARDGEWVALELAVTT